MDVETLWDIAKVVFIPLGVGGFVFLFRRQEDMHRENQDRSREHEELDIKRFDEVDEALQRQFADSNTGRARLHEKIETVKDALSRDIVDSRHRIANLMQAELSKIDDRIDGVMKLLLEQSKRN